MDTSPFYLYPSTPLPPISFHAPSISFHAPHSIPFHAHSLILHSMFLPFHSFPCSVLSLILSFHPPEALRETSPCSRCDGCSCCGGWCCGGWREAHPPIGFDDSESFVFIRPETKSARLSFDLEDRTEASMQAGRQASRQVFREGERETERQRSRHTDIHEFREG